MGPVAQVVEQLTFNQWVEGSNPSGLTNFHTDIIMYFFANSPFACLQLAYSLPKEIVMEFLVARDE